MNMMQSIREMPSLLTTWLKHLRDKQPPLRIHVYSENQLSELLKEAEVVEREEKCYNRPDNTHLRQWQQRLPRGDFLGGRFGPRSSLVL